MRLPPSTLLLGAWISIGATAAPNYASSLIEPGDDILRQHTAELNGDALQDLVVNVWSPENGRELLVYLQEGNGRFPGKPSRRIPVKKDIVAYALADLRDEPGQELVFLTRNGGYSYSTARDGYVGNLEKLFRWELLATVPERKSLPFLGQLKDYNGDGHPDMLLPGRHRYGLFLGNGEGSFQPATLLPEPHHDPRQQADNNISFDFSTDQGLTFAVENPSAFDGLFEEDSAPTTSARPAGIGPGKGESLLEVEQWINAVHSARINDDQLADFAFLDHAQESDDAEGGKRRFNLLIQTAEGINSEKSDWHSPLKGSGQVMLTDVDGDGLDDVLMVETRGSDQTSVIFFINREGRFDFTSPDQVMRFAGYEVEAEVRDLNDDGAPELIVSYYSLATVEALRSGSMLRTTLIYQGDAARSESGTDTPLFARRPSSKREDKFSAESIRGLLERLHFSADPDGDGHNEVVGLDDDGALVGRTIDDRLRIENEPFWRFVPLRLIQSIIPGNLNEDGATDFLLRHQNAVTVLVSRP